MYTLLHYASSCNNEEIFDFILSQCKNLEDVLLNDNPKNPTCETPLHFAVSSNNLEICKLLVEEIRKIVAPSPNESSFNFQNLNQFNKGLGAMVSPFEGGLGNRNNSDMDFDSARGLPDDSVNGDLDGFKGFTSNKAEG